MGVRQVQAYLLPASERRRGPACFADALAFWPGTGDDSGRYASRPMREVQCACQWSATAAQTLLALTMDLPGRPVESADLPHRRHHRPQEGARRCWHLRLAPVSAAIGDWSGMRSEEHTS